MFWSDAVSQLKREARYEDAITLCNKAKPCPAANQEIGICLRHIVRSEINSGITPPSRLGDVYRNAVEIHVLWSRPSVELSRALPGESTLRRVPGHNIASIMYRMPEYKAHECVYSTTGFNGMPTVGRTERQWLVKYWGEPAEHRDPFVELSHLWQRAIDQYVANRISTNAAHRADDWFTDALQQLEDESPS